MDNAGEDRILARQYQSCVAQGSRKAAIVPTGSRRPRPTPGREREARPRAYVKAAPSRPSHDRFVPQPGQNGEVSSNALPH